MKHPNPKPVVLAVVIGITVLAGVLATVWGYRLVVRQQAAWREARARLDALPEAQARAVALESDIAKRQLDIQRVEAFLISQEQLGGVVSDIEAIGAARGLTVTVPAVEEKQFVDENGNVIERKGPLLEVRLKVVAVGNPKQLLAFLHEIEHAQRLTYLESFRLDAAEATGRNQAAAFQKEGRAGQQLPAVLTADVIIDVRAEAGADL